MYCYKMKTIDGYCYFGGDYPPKNLEGLEQITEDEYNSAIAALEAEEQAALEGAEQAALEAEE